MLNVALPKGRLGDMAYELFEQAGYGIDDFDKNSRKLFFECPKKQIRYYLIKPSDVAVYVERGAADIGIVGKDILIESSADIYELLDLGIGKCRMCVCSENGYTDDGKSTLVVATKYPNVARNFFLDENREIDIIKLNGSIELAPLMGMANVIVDIVETGKTLRENNLKIDRDIVDISARLIACKSRYHFKKDIIDNITRSLSHD